MVLNISAIDNENSGEIESCLTKRGHTFTKKDELNFTLEINDRETAFQLLMALGRDGCAMGKSHLNGECIAN